MKVEMKVEMKVDPRRVAVVDNFADQLEIHPNTIKGLHRVRDNHIKWLLIDYGRRSLGEFLGLDSAPKVIKGVITMFHQSIGDRAVYERYQQWEAYPEGSLGHTVFIGTGIGIGHYLERKKHVWIALKSWLLPHPRWIYYRWPRRNQCSGI